MILNYFLIGDGKNKEKLKKYIKNHNLKNISFLGNLSKFYISYEKLRFDDSII